MQRMEISNNDLARILGGIEAKLDAQAQASERIERAVDALDSKLSGRLDEHDRRLRELETANPEKIAQAVAGHEKRIAELEKGAVRTGVIAGAGSAAGMAVLVEFMKHKLGL